eukprot:5871348-Alexandrium_andersonii.AAC.1
MDFPRQIMPQPSRASAGNLARTRPATSARPTPPQRSSNKGCCGAYRQAEKTTQPFPVCRGLITVGG